MMHARLGLSHKKKDVRLKSAVTFRWLNTHVIKVMIYLRRCWVPVNNLSLFRAMGQDLCEYLHKNPRKKDVICWADLRELRPYPPRRHSQRWKRLSAATINLSPPCVLVSIRTCIAAVRCHYRK